MKTVVDEVQVSDVLESADIKGASAVNIGDIKGNISEAVIAGGNVENVHIGDAIDVSQIESAAIATGQRAASATSGGIAVSGDVAGNLIISVGNKGFKISRWMQLFIVLITAGIIFLVSVQALDIWLPTPILPMTGDFNIAVAQFEVIGEGEGVKSAQELAQGFANSIEQASNELTTDLGLIELRSPQKTGNISGENEIARAENARKLAEAIGADVVIYGTIEVEGLKGKIKPEFYINKSRNDGLIEANEITGQYQMGLPILLEKVDNRTRRTEVATILEKRFQALTFIIDGLADYIVGEYAAAEISFNQALTQEAWNNREVINVLLGNAALKQYHLDKAQQYYQQALAENVKYSRAYAGLGSTLYLQAMGNSQNNSYASVDQVLLDQAIATYKQTLEPTLDHPPLADVITKAYFGLGQAYLIKALTEAQADNTQTAQQSWTQAVQSFRNVVDEYGEGKNPRIKEIAAHAHARLGLIWRFTNDLDQAANEYQQSIELLPELERTSAERAKYEAALGDIYGKLGKPTEAIRWYERAIGTAIPNSDEQAYYRQKLDELTKEIK